MWCVVGIPQVLFLVCGRVATLSLFFFFYFNIFFISISLLVASQVFELRHPMEYSKGDVTPIVDAREA